MNNILFRNKLNAQSSISVGLGCQSFKITKQNQNQKKTRCSVSSWCLVTKIIWWFLSVLQKICLLVSEKLLSVFRSWKPNGLPSDLYFFTLPSRFPKGTDADLCVRVQGPPWDRQGRTLQAGLIPQPGSGTAPGTGHLPGDGRGGPVSVGPMTELGRAGCRSWRLGTYSIAGARTKAWGYGWNQSWVIGWVGEAPGVGSEVSPFRAQILPLFEKESSNQRKTDFFFCWKKIMELQLNKCK